VCFVSIVFATFGCGKLNDNSLAGTKWKLVGIVDAQTNHITEIKPTDCDECYTLIFDTDATLLYGRSAANIVFLINLNPIKIQCGTYVLECFDGNEGEYNVYCNALRSVKSYELDGNQLKFFMDNNNYLLYKKIN
jgi:hypothetical protein